MKESLKSEEERRESVPRRPLFKNINNRVVDLATAERKRWNPYTKKVTSKVHVVTNQVSLTIMNATYLQAQALAAYNPRDAIVLVSLIRYELFLFFHR